MKLEDTVEKLTMSKEFSKYLMGQIEQLARLEREALERGTAASAGQGSGAVDAAAGRTEGGGISSLQQRISGLRDRFNMNNNTGAVPRVALPSDSAPMADIPAATRAVIIPSAHSEAPATSTIADVRSRLSRMRSAAPSEK
jgi:hypothetical protein